MDEKLTTMAKSTVFAGCTRRDLTRLGCLFEVACLSQGAAVPAGGAGRWLHVVLEGRALGVFEGAADCLLAEGDVWGSGLADTGGGALVALTDVTILTIGARSLRAVDDVAPSVASALRRARIPTPATISTITVTTPGHHVPAHWGDTAPVRTAAGSRNG
jgi:hypothetical protein